MAYRQWNITPVRRRVVQSSPSWHRRHQTGPQAFASMVTGYNSATYNLKEY